MTILRNYAKMSESESGSTAAMLKVDTDKKKLLHAQTQHGNADTADEENIVVLTTSPASPVREESDDVVWHEEVIETSQDDDDDVS